MATTAAVKSYPKKLYYKINEIAKITELKSHVLRYWESEFKELSPLKDENDQRRYREKDIQAILEIKHLLYEEGFTIKGARQHLKNRGKQPVAEVIEIHEDQKKDVRALKARKEQIDSISRQIISIRKEINDLCAFLNA